ncbi:MAG: hypothetical protein HDR08_16550 [Lachnospiraceae bacterium]|nr:hypothetical protein [Lachnospiraceae bacterium]
MSDIEFTAQNVHNSIWNSNSQPNIVASYKVPDDGVLKIICTGIYYRFANIGSSNRNFQWHTVTINNNQVFTTEEGTAVLITILTIDVKKDDIASHNYYIRYTSGDAIYAIQLSIH